EALFAERLRLAIEETNAAIYTESFSNSNCRGMGATFTAVALDRDMAYFAQIGDSRAHLIRDGQIKRITKDQSYVQQLVDLGQITEEEAETHSYRNYILQALGPMPTVSVEMSKMRLQPGDLLLLCSDGLSGKLRDPEMLEIVAKSGADLTAVCQELINAANERGGEDNITVVMAQFAGRASDSLGGTIPKPELVARAPDLEAASPDLPTAQKPSDSLPLNAALHSLNQTLNITADNQSPDLLAPHQTEMFSAAPVATAIDESSEKTIAVEVNKKMPDQVMKNEKRINGRTFAVLFMGTLIVLAALVIFMNNRLAGSRAAIQQRIHADEQARIVELRSRIEALRQRLSAGPQSEQTAKQEAHLDFLTERLNEASALPPAKFRDIGEIRVKVEGGLQEMEKQLPPLPEK
ncbi:MAG TPA: protein phosphatase 2C domain-containing protein, partial [Blastocatellia bacterium]|nr:protein phosphatase 2C domain-containing protein [Blastocatellia bacterium]